MGELLSLFGRNDEPVLALPPGADPDGLRPYQRETVQAAQHELLVKGLRGTMAVLATGLGKTQILSVLAKEWDGGVLVIAHRDELCDQLRARLIQITGEYVGLEKASSEASGERIAVAGIQTLAARKCRRAKRFKPGRFSLVITDECHHSVAKTYLALYELFADAKLFGVTATAGRKGLKKVYQSLCANLDLEWGIENAWLTPIDDKTVECDVNLDDVDVNKGTGDFVEAALANAMATAIAPIVDSIAEYMGDRRSLTFTPGVQMAHATAEAVNRKLAAAARAVDGTTDKDVRKALLAAHRAGQFLHLVNCNIFTEGYDDPGLRGGVVARPTKSWALLAQMLGRYTRLWPGIDKLATVEERRAAIAASPKPAVLVLRLGFDTTHELACPVDLLGGKYTDEERKRAKKELRKNGGDPRKALEEAREHIQRAAAVAARAKVKLTIRTDDPFSVLGVKDPERGRLYEVRPELLATKGQRGLLNFYGIDPPENLTKRQAGKLIGAEKMREATGLCNYRQVKWLAQFGLDGRRMYKATGKEIAEAFRANGKIMPARADIEAIIRRPRTVGAEG
jgi:superfamily II DNA or RNA helicase